MPRSFPRGEPTNGATSSLPDDIEIDGLFRKKKHSVPTQTEKNPWKTKGSSIPGSVGTPPLGPPPPLPPSMSYTLPHDKEDTLYFDVNETIEMIGWGRYQNGVICVMGMMSFADASEIWLSTIILKQLACEWGLSTLEKALVPSCVLFFMAIGSILSGKMADKFGRWPVLMVMYYLLCTFAIGSAFAPNYIFFLICRSICGFCIGASYGVSICYMAEVVPISDRSFNIFILDVFWTAGSIYICICAYFVMDLQNGWRIEVLLCALPCFITLFFLHFCDESPRFLAITNRMTEAKAVLRKMCEWNRVEMVKGDIMVSDQRRGQYGDIFSAPHTRTSIIIAILFFCQMYVVYGVLFLIPDMMSYGYCNMSEFFDTTWVSELGCVVYTKAEYLFFIVLCLFGYPGYIIGPYSAEKLGRKWSMVYSVWGSLIFTCFLLWCFGSVVIYIELFIAVCFYYIYDSILWIYAPEYYPTYMRSTAVGVQNGISKFGAAAGTFATEYLDTYDIRFTIYTYIFILFIASVTVLFMQTETKGVALTDERGQGGPDTGLVTESGRTHRRSERSYTQSEMSHTTPVNYGATAGGTPAVDTMG